MHAFLLLQAALAAKLASASTVVQVSGADALIAAPLVPTTRAIEVVDDVHLAGASDRSCSSWFCGAAITVLAGQELEVRSSGGARRRIDGSNTSAWTIAHVQAGGSLVLRGLVLGNVTASRNGYPAAIFADGARRLQIHDCVLAGNTGVVSRAEDWGSRMRQTIGGKPTWSALAVTNGAQVVIESSTFSDNTVSEENAQGAALFMDSGRVTIRDSIFLRNAVSANGAANKGMGNGGAVHVQLSSTFYGDHPPLKQIGSTDVTHLTIENSLFEANVADPRAANPIGDIRKNGGGAISVKGGVVLVRNTRFVRNRATPQGGGGALLVGEWETSEHLRGLRGARVEITGCEFDGNEAGAHEEQQKRGGSAIFAKNYARLVVDNSSFTNHPRGAVKIDIDEVEWPSSVVVAHSRFLTSWVENDSDQPDGAIRLTAPSVDKFLAYQNDFGPEGSDAELRAVAVASEYPGQSWRTHPKISTVNRNREGSNMKGIELNATKAALCAAGKSCEAGMLPVTVSSCATDQFPNGGLFCPEGTYLEPGKVYETEVECSPGYYCPLGTSAPQECPAGTSVRLAFPCLSLTSCKRTARRTELPQNCRLDVYRYSERVGAATIEECESITCPQGRFCPSGSTEGGYVCPPGLMQESEGASQCGETLCEAGFVCAAGSSSSHRLPSGCDEVHANDQGSDFQTPVSMCLCPGGYLCGEGTSLATMYLRPSPAGMYCPAGSTDSAGCLPCDEGWVCGEGTRECTDSRAEFEQQQWPYDSRLELYQNECKNRVTDLVKYPVPCPAGYWCPAETTPDTSRTHPCDAGFVCDEATSETARQNTRCPAGWYCSAGSKFHSSTDPVFQNICPEEKSCAGQLCPAGFVCANGTTDAAARATPCSAGFYCPKGTFPASEPVSTLCDTCPTPPKVCPEGYFCSAGLGLDPAQLSPPNCPAGYMCAAGTTNESKFSVPCPKGRYCLAGTAPGSQAECPQNHYCPLGTSIERGYRCPGGGISGFGSSSIEECVGVTLGICPAGSYYNIAQCEACPTGSYCTGVLESDASACASAGGFCSIRHPCEPGSFQQHLGRANCTLCPAGRYGSEGGGASEAGACKACPLGTEATEISRTGCSVIPPTVRFAEEELVAKEQALRKFGTLRWLPPSISARKVDAQGDDEAFIRERDLIVAVLALGSVSLLVLIMHPLAPRKAYEKLDMFSTSHKLTEEGDVQTKRSTALGFGFTLGFVPVAAIVALMLIQDNVPVTTDSLLPPTRETGLAKSAVLLRFIPFGGDTSASCDDGVIVSGAATLGCESFSVQATTSGNSGACEVRVEGEDCILPRLSAVELAVPWSMPAARWELIVGSARPGVENVLVGQISPANATHSLFRTHLLWGTSTVPLGVIPSFYNDTTKAGEGDGDARLPTGFALSLPEEVPSPSLVGFGENASLVGDHVFWSLRFELQRADIAFSVTKTAKQTPLQLTSAILAAIVSLLSVWRAGFSATETVLTKIRDRRSRQEQRSSKLPNPNVELVGKEVSVEMTVRQQQLTHHQFDLFRAEIRQELAKQERKLRAEVSAAMAGSPRSAEVRAVSSNDEDLPSGWMSATSPEGRAYYVDAATGTSTWVRPSI